MGPCVVTFMPTTVFWSRVCLDSQMIGNEETFWIRVSGEFGIFEDVTCGRGAGGISLSAGAPEERPASLELDFKM